MYGWIASLALLVSLAAIQPQEPSGSFVQNPIADFFFGVTTAPPNERGTKGQATFGKLTTDIETMTPAQITAGIEVIDHQLDGPAEPGDRDTKEYAANLFVFIGRRPDGPELLASQVDRLASMLLLLPGMRLGRP